MNNLKPIMTPAEVVTLAFPTTSHVRAAQITEADIVTAQEKFLAPVFGALWEALLEGKYQEFSDLYIKPTLAHFVKSRILPSLASVTALGVVEYNGNTSRNASDQQLLRLIRTAADTARTLRKRAIRQVETHPEEFPEYTSDQNILNRTHIAGGIVL